MYLQKIELSGFKSFANRAVLEFPPPDKKTKTRGITAIVGPNGSGKSNVVDAVRWVLGEQSLKLLRGKKATDVIFSGSSKKSQMSLAEVSLYLNNEDNNAPIDYSEVVITRKLYRDGSSEYLLNKNEVRLFDIVMLLAKANFGHNSYSIIGQGMVDKIVNYSGLERKEFFDEATGVKQYQIKRDRSVNKLKKSRENLGSARTLITELEPHLKSLTRQVNKLRQRQELETELQNLQSRYYGRLWRDLGKNYDEYALSYNTYEKQRLRLENRINELKEKLEELSQTGSRIEEYDKLQDEYNVLLSKQNETMRELAVFRGKLDVEYEKVGKQDLSFLENRKIELEEKLKEMSAESRSFELRLESSSSKLIEKERVVKILSDELFVWQNNLDIMQDEFYRLHHGGKFNFSQEAVKEILGLKNRIPGICGTVGELGKIKNKSNEIALVSAAGNRLSAVVVETDIDAIECINWLKQNRLPAVTFFPLNRLKNQYLSKEAKELSEYPDVIGIAYELLDYDQKYQKVFEQVFGSTIIIKDLDVAKSIGINRERMVTLNGDILEKTGIMKGGYRKPEKLVWRALEEQFFPEAKIKEIATLKAKLEDQRRERENLFLQIADLKIQVQTDGNKVKSLTQDDIFLKKELEKLNTLINESQLTPEERNQYLNEIVEKKELLENKLLEIENTIVDSREKIDRFNLEEERKKQEIFSLQQESYSLQDELNGNNLYLNEVKIELAKIETKKEEILNGIRDNLGDAWEFSNKEDYSDVDLISFKERIDRLRKQLELIGGIDPEAEKEYEEVSARFNFLTEQSLDLEVAIKDLEKVVEELDKLIKKQFEEEFEKINKDFTRYFKQLFDGGSAKLALMQKEEDQTEADKIRDQIVETGIIESEITVMDSESSELEEKKIIYPEDKSFFVNMGIEIEACPPGKKIKSITMLSGGEKTLTALALICSIINNNPSPFILFDEVDAALDESNSAKFGNIINELASKTQFVIITHNRAIMAESDVLYGVTMQGDGVSRLLGLKLGEAQEIGK